MREKETAVQSANERLQAMMREMAETIDIMASVQSSAGPMSLATLCDVALILPLFDDGVSEQEIVMIRNVLKRIVLPWEADNAKPPRYVRKNLAGEKVCVVDTHAGEDHHNPDANGVTWAVAPRHTKKKPTPANGIKTGKNCVYRAKQACDKAIEGYGEDIVNLKEWKE